MGGMQFSIDTNNNSTGKDFVWKHNGLGTTGSVLATLYGDDGALAIAGDLYVPDQIIHSGYDNTYMQFNAADTWRVVAGGSQKLVVNTSGVFVSNGVLDLNDNSLNDVATINMTNNGNINVWTSSSDTGTGKVNLPRGGHITFYGNSNVDHSIGSRNASGAITDDLRFGSYGAMYFDLDANNNNTSTADFVIGRHGSGTGSISEMYRFSGEYSNLDFKGNGNTTTGGNIYLGTTTNNATKFSSIVTRAYNSSTETEGFTTIGGVADGTTQKVIIGGGYLEQNSTNEIHFYTASGLSARTGTNRMIVKSDGKVGIGLDGPSYNLHVAGTGGAEGTLGVQSVGNSLFRLVANNGANCYFQAGTGTATSQVPMYFTGIKGSNNTLTINTTNKRVGVNDTTPDIFFGVYGDSSTMGTALFISPKGTNESHVHYGTYGNWYIRPAGSAAQLAGMYYMGQSDERLKENIEYVGKSSDGHNIYTWDWNDKAKELGIDNPTKGVIAQEVIKYMPEAVSKDTNGYYMVNYGAL